MKTMIRAVALALGLALAGLAVAGTAPDELVKKTTEEVLANIKANKAAYDKDSARLFSMVDEKVLPHFDFSRMAQWVLGRNWRTATPEQQAKFTAEFRDLLVRTYATALLKYNDQQVIYLSDGSRADGTEVTIKTEIKQASGAPNIPMNYSFYKKGEDWKVYDVVIEGVSLVTNYRSVYATRIQKEGMDALIVSIADSNRKARKGGT